MTHMENSKIRWMRNTDLLDVERVAVSCGLTVDSLCRFLARSRSACKVLECEGRVVGFVLYRTRSNKVDLHEIAIQEDFRRKSFGSKFIKSISKNYPVETLVSERNLNAHLFLKKNGFVAKEIIRKNEEIEYKFTLDTCNIS